MKIALFGAGSAQFGYGTLGDIFNSKILTAAQITLMDIDKSALDAVYRTGLEYIEKHSLDFRLSATTNRKEALKGADFIIISIEVGDRFKLWDMDWKVPLQFGIPQVYGENGGPGGIFHALRIIPPILEICDDAAEICPEAYIFNYSNPMTAITTTVLRKHPNLKFIGMCHEIASLERYLPDILGTSLENLHIRAAGLNHFSVLIEAKYTESGRDAYPEILEKASSIFEWEQGYSDIWNAIRMGDEIPETEGSTERLQDGSRKSSRPWSDRTLFKAILETYHLLPITVDSHLGEYISWARDIADHQGIFDFYEFYRYSLTRQVWSEIKSVTHERVVPVIDGILDDTGFEERAVNVMNNNAIPELPDSIAVEIPAVIDRRGINPIRFDSYPKGFAALLRSYCGVYDLTAEAVLECSRDLVIQAVLACPVVNKYRGMDRMVDTLIDNQREWLFYLK